MHLLQINSEYYSIGLAINNLGQVVGHTSNGLDTHYVFSWNEKAGASYLDTWHEMGVVDINDFGTAIGDTGEWYSRPFLWHQGSNPTVLDLPDNGIRGKANAINDAEWVAGSIQLPDGYDHACFWVPGAEPEDLGVINGYNTSEAMGVNDSGVVVGTSHLVESGPVVDGAFIWTRKDGLVDIGTLGGQSSVAMAINDRNQVVGYSMLANEQWAMFLWSADTSMQPIMFPDGWSLSPLAINNAGQIVLDAKPA